ncbi:AAA family ATPase [Candidatus Woesearchaeota archaeon]|nr:AAA family ATPase [Candidatus Woesearchaeota archaeon]
MVKGKSIGIISIKGGVGKTTSVINLAHVLANDFGKKVVVVDANFSSPNVALHLGAANNKYSIFDLLNGKVKLSDVIHEHEFGFHVLPGGMGNGFNSNANYMKLKEKVNQLKNHYDVVLLDSSPTLNNELLSTIVASDELYVVSTPDLPTLGTTLRAVKLARDKKMNINGLILNKVRSKNYELKSADMERLSGIPLVGVINDNVRVLEALSKVKPATMLNPNSDVSLAYKKIASKMLSLPYGEPKFHTKILGYLKDDFAKLKTHKWSKGLAYYK